MSSTPTLGVRTWRRTSADTTAPLAERVTETTRPEAMTAAIAAADFVTIPREGPVSSGYLDDYAQAFGAALAEGFSYVGGRRMSASGRSHVFERETAPQGAAVDLGVVIVPTSPGHDGRGHSGAQRPMPTYSGDGAPALHAAYPHPSLAAR